MVWQAACRDNANDPGRRQLAKAAAPAFSRQLTDVGQGHIGLGRDQWRLLYLLANGQGETSRDLGRNTLLDKVLGRLSPQDRRALMQGVAALLAATRDAVPQSDDAA